MVLLSEAGDVWLDGGIYARLASLMDGRRTIPDLVEAMQLPVADTLSALVLLGEAVPLVCGDHLADRSSHRPRFDPHGLDTGALDAAEQSLFGSAPTAHGADSRLPIVGAALADDLRIAIESLGPTVLDAPGPGRDALHVVTCDDLHPDVAELADRLASEDRPWLPMQPVGRKSWLGPWITPDICWRCLRQRLRANRAVESCLDLPPPRPWTAESVAWILELARRRALPADGSDSLLAGHRLVIDLESKRLTLHPVAGMAQRCRHRRPAKTASIHRTASIQLTERPRAHSRDGGHRTEPAHVTLRRLEASVDPVTGVVRSLRRRRTADENLSVFVAEPAYGGRVDDPRRLRKRLRMRCAGKGRSETQARVSALAEAVERYAGFQRPDDPVRVASRRELGALAVDPRSCLLFSDSQYENRKAWNLEEEHANWVPHPFDDDEPVEWTPVWSLRDDAERYLPTAWCYYDPLAGPSSYCRSDSNGSAAGSCLEEAVLQGFLELVERDAAALWWYSRARRPELPWPRHDEVWSHAVRSRLDDLDRDAWLLDLTHDLGVPVVVAVSRHRRRGAGDLLLGFGAHLDPSIAVERAVAELCQFLVTDATETGKELRLIEHAADGLDWIETHGTSVLGRFDLADHDLADEVRTCVSLAAGRGLDTLVLRQSRDEVPLEVVKVIVPGLRPWWARFAPGRLYDVPVELGWIPRPLKESELNPIHLFI